MLGSPIIIHAFAGYILPSAVVNTTKIVLGRTLVIYTYVCVPCMYSCTYSILYMYAYAHACKMSALLVCTCTCACMILCSGPYIYIYVHPAVSDYACQILMLFCLPDSDAVVEFVVELYGCCVCL